MNHQLMLQVIAVPLARQIEVRMIRRIQTVSLSVVAEYSIFNVFSLAGIE